MPCWRNGDLVLELTKITIYRRINWMECMHMRSCARVLDANGTCHWATVDPTNL